MNGPFFKKAFKLAESAHLVELSKMIGGCLTINGTSAVSLSVKAINTWHW